MAVLLACCLCTLPVMAAGETWTPDVKPLEDQLPEEAARLMDGQSPLSMPDERVLRRLWQSLVEMLRKSLLSACRTAGVILAVTVICSMADAMDVGSRAPRYILLAGVAAISTVAVVDFDSYMGMGLEGLETLSEYSHVLLPTLSTVAAASGAAASAAAKYAATALFMDILLGVGRSVVMPAVFGYAALSVAGAAVGSSALKSAKKLMKSICSYLLTGLALAFTGWLAITGVISGSADSLTSRLTKTAVSAALPVVGSVISDAAGTLAAAVSAVKGTIGVFGMLAVLCVCLGPFAVLGIRYLLYKLAAVISGCVSDGRLADLIEAMGTCFGMVLALTGVGALMMFVSIFSLMRTVL